MTRSAAFLVAAVLLCVILSSEASDELQCTGERGDDGLLHFKISPDPKDQASDCEVQWIVNGTVVGIFEHDEKPSIVLPIIMATGKTAILQGSPNKVEWMLICPSTSIDERRQCSCEACKCNDTPPTGLPEGYKISVTTLTTLAEGSPNKNTYIWIGVASAVLAITFIVVVIYCKRQRQDYSRAQTVENV